VRFPLFQLAVVVALILLLHAADDKSALGRFFNGLDKLVESTVGSLSALANVKSFTKSWLTTCTAKWPSRSPKWRKCRTTDHDGFPIALTNCARRK
jgi:hypothetical protein